MKPKIEVETKSYITMVKIMFNILLIICIFIFSNKYFFILSIKIRGFLFLKKNWLKELKLEFKNPIFLVDYFYKKTYYIFMISKIG